MSTIESVLQESRAFPPPESFVKQANISGMAAYKALCDEAERDFEGFWARLARENLIWHKPFTKVRDESEAPFFRWFDDGELNASCNCLDRHLVAFVVTQGPRPSGAEAKAMAKGEEITQDISTLENPAILDQLKQNL